MAKKRQTEVVDAPVAQRFRSEIFIKGARGNNLQNIDLHIPKNKLVVVTGVSGSGKSSITMDTLYAEGQRRYVESLSSYARQFLGRMKKPDVDFIKGICPAIAIEQKVTSGNNRSTVGSMTEIYDFMRLLYARIGKTYSPISGDLVTRHRVTDVADYIQSLEEGMKVQLMMPLNTKYEDRTLAQELALLLQKGYTRIFHESEMKHIEDFVATKSKLLSKTLNKIGKEEVRVLIDRFVVKKDDEENKKRISDSVNTAFYESEGNCIVMPIGDEKLTKGFNNRFELDGMEFPDPAPQLFNYNNPFGACPQCEGYGKVMGIDQNKVVPDSTKSVYEKAIACWKGEKFGLWLEDFLNVAHQFDFPVHTAYEELTKAQKKLLWTGNKHFRGINDFFSELEEKTYKIQNRVMLARYRGRTTCPTCDGGRLRPEANYVKVNGSSITDLIDMPLDELSGFFDGIELSDFDTKVGSRLLLEITSRLHFMKDVGLAYLTLNRVSNTLSGGETQRINLTRTLGSNLTSSMYILDEPSVGLHPRDTERLVTVLKNLRDLGNTVIVVEHEEEVIKNADYLIDIGPEAGVHGGHVVFAGAYEKIYTDAATSLTTKYMNGTMSIQLPDIRRKAVRFMEVKGARQHNLKNIDVEIPLNCLSVVSGVSGSGKTTLVKQILYPALKKHFGEGMKVAPGAFNELVGDMDALTGVEMVSQSPIGKSSRSNPVTYVKAYDAIRDLMSKQQLAKIRGYKPKHFSFNVEGGRCENCKGEGETIVEMQFLADIKLECEDCKGRRFKHEVLEVNFKGKNIYDILSLTVDEAIEFFENQKDVLTKIKPLQSVGLGYVQLGQSSSTLSGGEAQRVKLASFLNKKGKSEHIFFIFDEPTTGLHFHDIQKLLDALQALVEKGHSVLVVEHNMEVIKSADWVIDLGPEGGKGGGNLVYQGTPEGLSMVEGSYTGQFLKEKV